MMSAMVGITFENQLRSGIHSNADVILETKRVNTLFVDAVFVRYATCYWDEW